MAQSLLVRGILSYPNVFEAKRINETSDPKFSTSILIPKTDLEQIAKIQAAIETEKTVGFPKGFPPKGTLCLKDCVDEFPLQPDIADYCVIPTSTGANQKPFVVDLDKQDVIDPSLVFAGAEALVSINICFYNKPMNKGVTAYLGGLMLTGNTGALGRIDGRPTVEQMFADVTPDGQIIEQGIPPVTQQVQPVQQVQPATFHKMTGTATGTYEQMIAAGWTDALLIQHGHMTA